MFKEYMHIEKFGNLEVEGIELGQVYVFPKLDGTNGSIWWEEASNGERGWEIKGASRTRQLSFDADNAGFLHYFYNENGYDSLHGDFLERHSHLRLFGEWLVPHTFKGYREDAWRKFYVFDVYNDDTHQYLSYEAYKPLLDQYGIEYIPPLAIIKNASYENFLRILNQNFFLCPDGGEPGEGIVIKNYDYENKFGRQCFAKIIRNEFKDLHNKTMGSPEINMGRMNEERILNKVLTLALIDKTIAKIQTDHGAWIPRYIPELFGRIYYDIIKEELFDALKEINFGTINFKTLKAIMIMKIKQLKPELF